MDQRVQIVRSAIERDCRRAWTITALAKLVNLSPSRLRHLFKSETGITPNQFIKEVRLREAEKLLRTTFLRTLAAVFGGYLLAHAFSALSASVLPFARPIRPRRYGHRGRR